MLIWCPYCSELSSSSKKDGEVVGVPRKVNISVKPAVMYVFLLAGQRGHDAAKIMESAVNPHSVRQHLNQCLSRLTVVQRSGDHGIAEMHLDPGAPM